MRVIEQKFETDISLFVVFQCCRTMAQNSLKYHSAIQGRNPIKWIVNPDSEPSEIPQIKNPKFSFCL